MSEYEGEFADFGEDFGDPEGEAELEAYLAEPEPVQGPPEDTRLLSPDEWQFDYAQRTAAVEAVEAETNQAERLAYVAERADGFGNPEVYARVDEQVTQAAGEVYMNLMASGYTEAQAREWIVANADWDAATDAALQLEREKAFRDSTSLGPWQEGRAEQARQDALMGRPPRPDILAHPAIAKLGRTLAANAERVQAWNDGIDAAYRRQTGQ